MSLIRSSMIAGVTTGLLGIGAMTLGDKESYKEPYFWSATVSTAIVGGLAWAILHNEKIEETLELNADYYDNYGDMEYIILEMLTDEQLEAEYGDYMREHQNGPLSREDLPTALDNDYRTDEEAPYLRKKYFDEEYHAEYDFKNHAITTVVADDEDEAWDNFAKGDEAWQQWEIVEVREGESSNFLSLAAEFAADRKARRRTRLSWTRGFEPAFTDSDGYWDDTAPNGYSKPDYWLMDNPNPMTNFAHYHIDFGGKTGTEGYHIHLWKPKGRPRWNRPWKAMAKSPNEDWKSFTDSNKGNLTPKLLKWYNESIDAPTKTETSGFMEYLIQTGAVEGGLQLIRKYQPAIERRKKDTEKGIRRGVTFQTDGMTTIYFAGGDITTPYPLMKYIDGSRVVQFETPLESIPEEIMPFTQMLLFAQGGTQANSKLADICSQRSVNRYNKSLETWVKSFPAWFNNAVKNDIYRVHNTMHREQWDSPKTLAFKINDTNFIRWVDKDEEYDYRSWDWGKVMEDEKAFQVVEEREVDGVMKYYWTDPRPSTIRKMYQNCPSGDTVFAKDKAEHIFYQCVEKYQPQKMKRVHDSMVKQPNILRTQNLDDAGFGVSRRSSEMMCRRFKKNNK